MNHFNRRAVVAACLALSASQASYAQLFSLSKPPEAVGIGEKGDRDKAFNAWINDGNPLRHITKVYSGDIKDVAITGVVLQFVTETSVTATTKAFLDRNVSTSKDVTYRLLGVDPKVYQAIADQFADDLRKAIAARGYNVVDQDKVANLLPDFAALVKAAENPEVSKGFFTNSGSTAVAAKGTANMNGMSGGLMLRKLLAERQETNFFSVKLVINFAKLENTTSFFSQFGTTISAQVSHGLQSTIVQEGSAVNLNNYWGKGGGQYNFMQVALLPSEVSKEVKNVGSSGGQLAANVLTGLLTMGKSINSSSNFEATAVPNYQEVMSADLKNVAEVLAAALEKKAN